MTGHYIEFETRNRAVLKPFEVQPPGPGQVLVENLYTVISAGTERANLIGLPNTSGTFPHRPGYCGLGRVTEVGDGVTGIALGERALAALPATGPTRCSWRAGPTWSGTTASSRSTRRSW